MRLLTSPHIFLSAGEVEYLGHLGFLLSDLLNIHYLVFHGVVFLK